MAPRGVDTRPGLHRRREPGPYGDGRAPDDTDVLTSGQAADSIGTSDDTIRTWIDGDRLDGWWVQRNQRRRYFTTARALAAAPVPARGPRRRSVPTANPDAVLTELRGLRDEVRRLHTRLDAGDSGEAQAELRQLRALVANLREAGLRMRSVADHMQQAHEAQQLATNHMQAAAREQGDALLPFLVDDYLDDAQ